MGIEINKIEEYLPILYSSLLNDDCEEEKIRTKLEEEFIKNKSAFEEKNENSYLNRRDKCRLGLYLLDLVVTNANAKYYCELKSKTVVSDLNIESSKTWNSVLKMINQKLDSGKHIVEVVREISSY